jgi:hypothetical protein
VSQLIPIVSPTLPALIAAAGAHRRQGSGSRPRRQSAVGPSHPSMVEGLRHGAFRPANANVQQDTGRKQASGNATARGQCREATASRFAPDSPLEEAGFELVWGFFCQVVVFGLLPVLCSEREGRSSFFNRAAGVKRVLSASGLRRIVVKYAGGTSLAKCCFFVRLRAVSSSRPVNRHAKRTSLRRWVRLCPGSEQEGPARVARCPHERRSGARGRCLFAHRGKAPGWYSAAVF